MKLRWRPIRAAVNTTIGQLYSALNPVVSAVIAPSTGIVATETANDQQQITQLTQQISTLSAQEQQQALALQAEFAQIQAVVNSYQNLAQLFASSSSSSSSSSSELLNPDARIEFDRYRLTSNLDENLPWLT